MEELIKDGAIQEGVAPVPEPTVTFKMLSDRSILDVRSEIVNVSVAEISGYDLQIKFNMQYINSTEDIENLLEGFKVLFRQQLLEQILKNKKNPEDTQEV